MLLVPFQLNRFLWTVLESNLSTSFNICFVGIDPEFQSTFNDCVHTHVESSIRAEIRGYYIIPVLCLT